MGGEDLVGPFEVVHLDQPAVGADDDVQRPAGLSLGDLLGCGKVVGQRLGPEVDDGLGEGGRQLRQAPNPLVPFMALP
jgi:hypothetical protein